MQAQYSVLAALCSVWVGIVLAREGGLGDLTDGECPPLKIEGVDTTPQEGVVNYEDIKKGTEIECKLSSENSGDESKDKKDTVSDEEWKWERTECDTEEDPETVVLDDMKTSKISKKDLKKMTDKLTGWHKLKCSKGDKFGELRINAGNTTKGPKLPFRVKRFDKSKVVVEKEDFLVFCEIVNRTELRDEESIEEGLERLKKELNVRWYKWSVAEDQSPLKPPPEDVPVKHNCTEDSMEGSIGN